MLDTSALVGNISFILVFFAGLMSFFSPCVLPLLPIYLGYLSGNTTAGEYHSKKIIVNTIGFVLGISTTFFLLGLTFTNLAQFFASNQHIITKISGIIVILFGLVQIDFIEFKLFNREKRLNTNFNEKKMNPLVAFFMGLTFSFAWTPCVGPMLASVLLLASSAQNIFLGNLLVLVYTIGFIIPFILAGLFTTKLLNIFSKYKNTVKYFKKAGGIILIVMGIMMFTGWLNTFSGYLNTLPTVEVPPVESVQIVEEASPEVIEDAKEPASEAIDAANDDLQAISDFTLSDQHGNAHTLSEYEGKVVFLNFWATGCPPCQKEIPHIIDLYEENTNENVVILTVVNPNGFLEKDTDYIMAYIEDKGIPFPVLFDNTGEIFDSYGISSIPTTFMVTDSSKVFGYINGALDRSIMDNIINQTVAYSE
jgi:cytochrome c-type biogenesis protein